MKGSVSVSLTLFWVPCWLVAVRAAGWKSCSQAPWCKPPRHLVSSEDGRLGRPFSQSLVPAYLLFTEKHSCTYIYPVLQDRGLGGQPCQGCALSSAFPLGRPRSYPPCPLLLTMGISSTDERLMVGKPVRKYNAENTTLGRELFVLLFERAQDLVKGV